MGKHLGRALNIDSTTLLRLEGKIDRLIKEANDREVIAEGRFVTLEGTATRHNETLANHIATEDTFVSEQRRASRQTVELTARYMADVSAKMAEATAAMDLVLVKLEAKTTINSHEISGITSKASALTKYIIATLLGLTAWLAQEHFKK